MATTTKPYILLVDDDPAVLSALRAQIRQHYRERYSIIDAPSGPEAIDLLTRLKKRSARLALIISDQRMPDMDGITFLGKAKELFPDSTLVLLTAYADTEAAIRAINVVRLNHYLVKPWEPADEKLYPILDDLLSEWDSAHASDTATLRLIGYDWDKESHTLKEFLTGNLVPYQWVNAAKDSTIQAEIKAGTLLEKDLPMLRQPDSEPMVHPDIAQISERLNLSQASCDSAYQLTIIGAGPAGMAAAVYGASEGLRTLMIEGHTPGGQAGTSSWIENYLGFPTGISGQELTRRALTQAKRLGTDFLTPFKVDNITLQNGYKILHLNDGRQITTEAVIIATGVEYRQLDAPGLEQFNGAGIYYGAATTEGQACAGSPVFIAGGGNSAGQAAMFLSNYASQVNILVRSTEGLNQTMSSYLIEQIKNRPNINVRPCCQVVEGGGENDRLTWLSIHNADTKQTTREPASALFIFIGTRPVTDWIGLNIIKNEKGYLETGRDLFNYPTFKKSWKLKRDPSLLETCVPGIYAAGDVRSGAMNRVAAAVGEGAMAVKLVHEYLSR
jgi:thioredoxin reductase (NADPH)